MKTDNYIAAVLAHFAERGIRPDVHHVEVRHDDDCGMWSGDPCDCSPVVESGDRVDQKYREQTEK